MRNAVVEKAAFPPGASAIEARHRTHREGVYVGVYAQSAARPARRYDPNATPRACEYEGEARSLDDPINTPPHFSIIGYGTAAATRISREPDVCGGDACIRHTRIPVWVLVNYRRLGGSDADLLRDYPSLTPDDLEAAWAYATAHAGEIDRAIRENEQGDEGLVE